MTSAENELGFTDRVWSEDRNQPLDLSASAFLSEWVVIGHIDAASFCSFQRRQKSYCDAKAYILAPLAPFVPEARAKLNREATTTILNDAARLSHTVVP